MQTVLMILGALLGHGTGVAQAKSANHGPYQGEQTLKLVVLLSRHGVRSPTWTLDRLNAYSANPWPAWSVEPGILTTRGYELLKQFGSYDRELYAKEGFVSAHGCSDVSSVYVWADTDQRTLASAHALSESLYPGCPPDVHSLGEGNNDTLFHPDMDGIYPEVADAAYAEVTKSLANLPPQPEGKLLADLQTILLGCPPATDCKPAHNPEMKIDGKSSVARGTGDKLVSLKGPIPLGSTFSEDLLLEYAEGMPMAEVGWGNVDKAEIGQLLALHSVYFDLIHRTPTLAKLEASNMLHTIAQTLAQGVSGKAVDGAKGEPGDKIVMIVGHDTNIGGIASLLGIHWKVDGRDDDTPPGTEVYFELWQGKTGEYFVRTRVAMQTLGQLRDMQALTISNPPASQTVVPKECDVERSACSWSKFLSITNTSTGMSAYK